MHSAVNTRRFLRGSPYEMALLSKELQEAGVDPNIYRATLNMYTCRSGVTAIPRRHVFTDPGASRFAVSLQSPMAINTKRVCNNNSPRKGVPPPPHQLSQSN